MSECCLSQICKRIDNKKDEKGVVVRNKARLVAQGHMQEEGIDYDEVFALTTRIEAIRIFLAFASYMGYIVYQMDVKSAFLYGTIDEEVYVTQPPGFVDPKFPNKVYKVMKALYGLHQAPGACQNEEAADVDVYLYSSMIGSLMYLTASRPDIMFVVCACSRFQVTPKTSHLQAVKRIFRRLISWQCKKQTIMATSTTKAEYVDVAHSTFVKGRLLKVTTAKQRLLLPSIGKDCAKIIKKQSKPNNIEPEIERLHQKPDQRTSSAKARKEVDFVGFAFQILKFHSIQMRILSMILKIFSDYSPQPQYETYPCKLSENDSHYGYDCLPRFPLVYEQKPVFNDSQTIDEMFKQRKQTTNLAEQEEQVDDEEVLQDREKFMKDVQTFLEKFNRYSFEVMPRGLSIAWERISKIKYVFTEPEEIPELMCKLLEDVKNIRVELAEYINSLSWNSPTFFYDDDEEYSIQYKEYLEKSSDAIAPILPTEEPEYSLSMGYEQLSTTPETELDEVTKSSAKNPLPIPSEYEVTFDDESECEVLDKDDSSPVFTTFSNPLFDDNDDFTSSDDESLPDEDVSIENFKVYSNPLFDDGEINSDKSSLVNSLINPILPEIKEADFDLEEEIRFVENLLYDNSSPRPPEELNAEITDTIFEYLSPSHIPVEDSDSLMDEIDLFLATDELLPPNIESDGYDSEGDIHFLKELLIDNSIPLFENESSDFDHHNSLFPRPPPKPPDVEFDFEPNSGEVISTVMNNNDELNCFDPGGEINVFTNVEDDDYFAFMFVIRIFLPYLIYPEVSPLLFSAGSEDTIFNPGISV
nr:copia protein [Tanacetum cinerariifolium]